MTTTADTPRPARVLPVIVLSQFAGTSLWFAGNALLPDLERQFALGQQAVATVTSAVQLGFIAGTLVFALLNLADRFQARAVFLASAVLGAVANASMLALAYLESPYLALLGLRFVTGFFLAGIYPVGMKIAASWYRQGLGGALGFLVGALVLGTALPHLVRGLGGGLPWQSVSITLSLLAGLWWTWWDALPALTVIGDHALWTYTETVGGKEVTQALTVGHLFLALLVVVVTAVAVGRVGALLDILLLQRFEMQADATYAIKVITRYAIAAGGIVLASNFLGIGWSDVQWLVAALSVGLGFGLQEIVANFISGLIVLAERPIRIGDVVTVGDITGTVARIRARATAVIDFDNKEVIIPNKAFITERVVNWTLSNETTRLLLKVGVAYGSDIEQVRKVLLDAVQGIDEVLQDPPPSVYMRGFGDSSLDFEIRAYVDAFGKRLQVQHRINLEVARALAEHGIEIPFPQRDLHIASAPGLAGALSGDRRG